MPQAPNLQRIQQLAQAYAQRRQEAVRPAPSFGIPKAKTIDEEINAMPNANKLTQNEKRIYGALPGITTWMENSRIMGKTVSEQLDKFNNGWLGKALNFLDVGAEGLERTAGLFSQMRDPDFDMSELQSAWYAGSLTYDTTNLPIFKRDPGGQISGMRIPTDLPGSGGLSNARATIQRYIDQGMDPKDALAKARDELYGGLGALSLRAQLNDTYGHVLLDPINVLTAYLKPIQALKARRFTALASKVTCSAEEFIQAADKAGDLIRTAGNARDALEAWQPRTPRSFRMKH